MSQTERVAVLGGGSWGATMAHLLADRGHDVSLWEYNPSAADALSKTRRLSVLPHLTLVDTVQVTSDIASAVQGRGVVLTITPSHVVRQTMKAAYASGKLDPHALHVSAAKGLEEGSLKRMSEIIAEEAHRSPTDMVVLTGPSHAEEVCRRMATAIVVATPQARHAARAQALFATDFLRVYRETDLAGAELGGALKNTFAIACGISDGLGLGDNAKAALMTRGLNEMVRMGVKLGAKAKTFFGLTGMGDLIVTCLSQHSRNRLLGEKIGRGQTPAAALAEMSMVAEGYKTAPSSMALMNRFQLDCPLTREIYEVLYRGKEARRSLQDLMARQPQAEWQGVEVFQDE